MLAAHAVQATNPLGDAGGDIASVQAAIMAVQKCMAQHGGSFLQFRCDEKGFLSICAFGLPGRTHEDDPARGVLAALDLVEALRFLKGVRHVKVISMLTVWHSGIAPCLPTGGRNHPARGVHGAWSLFSSPSQRQSTLLPVFPGPYTPMLHKPCLVLHLCNTGNYVCHIHSL